MRHRFLGPALSWLLIGMGATLAYAQGGNTSAPLTGTVADASGAPVPGASVVVKNEGTGATYQAVSGAGAWGLYELDAQLKAYAAGEPIRREKFPHQIANNLFSHNTRIDSATEAGELDPEDALANAGDDPIVQFRAQLAGVERIAPEPVLMVLASWAATGDVHSAPPKELQGAEKK